MPSRSVVYNPDAKISADQRKKNAEAARARSGEHADAVRTFSPWELEELRMDLLALSSPRADRFITLIDAHDASLDFAQTVSAALDGAELDGLGDVVDKVEEDIHEEIDHECSDQIDELLSDHPEATQAQLLGLFKVWHAEECKRLKLEVSRALGPITRAIETAKSALEPLG